MFAAEQLPKFVAKQQAVQILAASAETPDRPYLAFPAILDLGAEVLVSFKHGCAHAGDPNAPLKWLRYDKASGRTPPQGTLAAVNEEIMQMGEWVRFPNGDIANYVDAQKPRALRTGLAVVRSTDGGRAFGPLQRVGQVDGVEYGYAFDSISRNGSTWMLVMTFANLPGGKLVYKYSSQPGSVDVLPGQEIHDRVLERTVGAFGHVVGARYQTPMMMHCCTANASQGLYYAWEAILRQSGTGADVNLWLNRRSPWVDVWSWLPHEGKLLVQNKGLRQLTVRKPGWAHRERIRCQVNGRDAETRWIGGRMIFDGLQGTETLVITTPVNVESATYTMVNLADPQNSRELYRCEFRGHTAVDVQRLVAGSDPHESSSVLNEPSSAGAASSPFRPARRASNSSAKASLPFLPANHAVSL